MVKYCHTANLKHLMKRFWPDTDAVPLTIGMLWEEPLVCPQLRAFSDKVTAEVPDDFPLPSRAKLVLCH